MLLMTVCKSDNNYTDICKISNDAECEEQCPDHWDLEDLNCPCRNTEETYLATNIFHDDVKRCCMDHEDDRG